MQWFTFCAMSLQSHAFFVLMITFSCNCMHKLYCYAFNALPSHCFTLTFVKSQIKSILEQHWKCQCRSYCRPSISCCGFVCLFVWPALLACWREWSFNLIGSYVGDCSREKHGRSQMDVVLEVQWGLMWHKAWWGERMQILECEHLGLVMVHENVALNVTMLLSTSWLWCLASDYDSEIMIHNAIYALHALYVFFMHILQKMPRNKSKHQ